MHCIRQGPLVQAVVQDRLKTVGCRRRDTVCILQALVIPEIKWMSNNSKWMQMDEQMDKRQVGNQSKKVGNRCVRMIPHGDRSELL